MFRKLFLATALAAILAAPAMAQQTARDLSIEQNAALAPLPARPGNLGAAVWFDRAEPVYARGEAVRIFLQTQEDGYATVLSVGPSGEVTQIFPNAFHPDNFVRADTPIEIPGRDARALVTGPVGAEVVKVIVTSQLVPILPEAQLTTRDAFRSLNGGVGAMNRNLSLLADAPEELKIAVVNRTFRTIAARQASNGIVVIVPGSPAPAASYPLPPAPAVAPAVVVAPNVPQHLVHVDVAPTGTVAAPGPASPIAIIPISGARNPFSLTVAADKPSYAPGEPMAVSVTAARPCYLTVFDIDATGRSRIAFPNQKQQNNRLEPAQTVQVAGGAEGAALEARGPVGRAQLIATCTEDPAPVSSVAFDFSQSFTPAGERDALARDLAAAQARAPGAIALAAATVLVQPRAE